MSISKLPEPDSLLEADGFAGEVVSPKSGSLRDPDRMQSMAKSLSADDILPLVASLTPQERESLLRLIALPQGGDAPGYRSVPPLRDEFSADEEPLAWDAEGWELHFQKSVSFRNSANCSDSSPR